MGGRAKLIVAQPLKGDSGVARLDTATRTYLGVEPGDEVDIFGGIFSPAHVRAKVAEAPPEDEGKGIVRIASDKMQEGGFKVGMKVTVDASLLKTLRETVRLKKEEGTS